MTYNYSKLRREYNEYMRAVRAKCMMQFHMKLEDLLSRSDLTEEQEKFVRFYKKLMPVTANGHVVNRISEIVEREFKGTPIFSPFGDFDKNVLKSGRSEAVTYYVSKNLTSVYKTYLRLAKQLIAEKTDDDDASAIIIANCIRQCDSICPNKEQQADFLIDLLYDTQVSKRFVWLVCGDWIINNMLEVSGGMIHYPVATYDSDVEFYYQGRPYKMASYNVWGGEDYDTNSYE